MLEMSALQQKWQTIKKCSNGKRTMIKIIWINSAASQNVTNLIQICHSFTILKLPSGQIGSPWECYHWIGLEKDINHHRLKKNEFNLLLVRNMQAVILSVSWILSYFSMMRAILYFCLYYCITVSKPWSELCGELHVVVLIADCWYSSNILRAVIQRTIVDTPAIFWSIVWRKRSRFAPYDPSAE
jgi:hypothetical protein